MRHGGGGPRSGGRGACSDTADIITRDCCMKVSSFVQQSHLCLACFDGEGNLFYRENIYNTEIVRLE